MPSWARVLLYWHPESTNSVLRFAPMHIHGDCHNPISAWRIELFPPIHLCFITEEILVTKADIVRLQLSGLGPMFILQVQKGSKIENLEFSDFPERKIGSANKQVGAYPGCWIGNQHCLPLTVCLRASTREHIMPVARAIPGLSGSTDHKGRWYSTEASLVPGGHDGAQQTFWVQPRRDNYTVPCGHHIHLWPLKLQWNKI